MAIALSVFYPLITPFVPNCPDFAIKDAVLATIQDFYRRTGEKVEDLPAYNIVAGQSLYTMVASNAHIYDVEAVVFDGDGLDPATFPTLETRFGDDWRNRSGTPEYYYIPSLDVIRLVLTPDTSITGGLKISAVTYPSSTAVSFDDVLLEEHRDAIVNGAVGRLMIQAGKDWSNPQQGIAHIQLYDKMVWKHASRVAKGRVRARRRTVSSYF